MIREIDITLMSPHPENSNRMDAETLTKLRKHIEQTGRYEPIIVRPHPAQQGRFQVINGHHRLQVLKALGHAAANCIVWNVNDEQTRLYLATLNRLSGEDIPERRAMLVGNLLETFSLDELSALLPEGRDQLAELERLAKVEPDDLLAAPQEADESTPRVILEFFLEHERAKEVNLALDLIAHRCPNMAARSDALVQLARSYLATNPPTTCNVTTVNAKPRAD
jgi:ParB/RepB/Spo0J family partition protein